MIDFDQLDRVIHEKGRLSIMSLLAIQPTWGFAELKAELRMSDGNLITHLRTLEKAGYVLVEKNPVPDRRKASTYAISPAGREAYTKYLAILEQIIQMGR